MTTNSFLSLGTTISYNLFNGGEMDSILNSVAKVTSPSLWDMKIGILLLVFAIAGVFLLLLDKKVAALCCTVACLVEVFNVVFILVKVKRFVKQMMDLAGLASTFSGSADALQMMGNNDILKYGIGFYLCLLGSILFFVGIVLSMVYGMYNVKRLQAYMPNPQMYAEMQRANMNQGYQTTPAGNVNNNANQFSAEPAGVQNATMNQSYQATPAENVNNNVNQFSAESSGTQTTGMEKRICSACGAEVDGDSLFCTSCGKKM